MRILHTGDWHVGKLLCGRPRYTEQAAVFDEIAAIAETERADVVLAAGDIFDTATPSAAAEALFYRAALRMAEGRHFVAIAGNHDDPERLRAPETLAAACNITLYGGGVCSKAAGVETGEGWLRVRINNETLNLAMVPFPSHARLGAAQDLPYAELFGQCSTPACACFQDGGINVLAAHVFMLGSTPQSGEERELGSARLLPLSALPDTAVYTALGHIHKPMAVSKSRNIYYSGSVLSYSFDDNTKKRVLIVDTDGKHTTVKSVPLQSGKALIRVTAEDEDEAQRLVEAHPDKHVSLLYRSDTPLSPSRVKSLKAGGNLVEILVEHTGAKRETAQRKGKTDAELFALFHESRTGKAPDEALGTLFHELMPGEKEGQ